jgi:hypothetical protein
MLSPTVSTVRRQNFCDARDTRSVYVRQIRSERSSHIGGISQKDTSLSVATTTCT